LHVVAIDHSGATSESANQPTGNAPLSHGAHNPCSPTRSLPRSTASRGGGERCALTLVDIGLKSWSRAVRITFLFTSTSEALVSLCSIDGGKDDQWPA
jgi:hypothetical protein